MPKVKESLFIPFFLSLILIVADLGCSHRAHFRDHLQTRNCEQALLEVPENQSLYQISSRSQQAGGTLISYSFVGAAYTAQILWDVSVGLTSAIVLCSPQIALAIGGSTKPASHQGPTCFSADISPLLSPPLGRQALNASESLRCPDLSGLTASLRQVAACFASKGGVGDRGRASKILESLQNSGGFYSCVSGEDRILVERDMAAYQRGDSMGAADPTTSSTPTIDSGQSRKGLLSPK